MIIVIGRGNSGTRAIAETLYQSGIYIGSNRSATFDMVPAEGMYHAAKIVGGFVNYIDTPKKLAEKIEFIIKLSDSEKAKIINKSYQKFLNNWEISNYIDNYKKLFFEFI